jgi:type I restriction enzyme S subunit
MSAEWRTRKLGEILDVQNGFAFDSERFSESHGLPLIRIRDLKNGAATVVRYGGDYDEKFVVRDGDFLIGMDGEFRCYKWRGQDALLNQRVCRLVQFSDEIDPEFVGFGINAHLKKIEDITPYVTVKHLSAKSIREIEFTYPNLFEQRRIVARIKECMEREEEIDILKRESLQEAVAVLPSILNEVFASQARQASLLTIGEVALETRYGTSQKCHSNQKGLAILRIPNVAKGAINLNDLKYCDLTDNEAARICLKPGDLLFVRTNGSRDLVGRCAVFDLSEQELNFGFASYLIRVRVDQSKVLPRYLAYFLNSTNGRSELDSRRRTSAGQFNINSENLRSIPLPVPSIQVQLGLLAQLQQRELQANQLASELVSVNTESDGLREAILRKAFAGEL